MKSVDDLILLDGPTVRNLLEGCELEICDVVRNAYVDYARGKYSLPHSTFLKFADNPSNRIIALPAYLGGSSNVAGLKWVSSFPGNISCGMDRASAALILNDTQTGRPIAFLEASSINACRTAASAAIAAQVLSHEDSPDSSAFIGCGYIGFEMANYLQRTFPSIREVVLFDSRIERAKFFTTRLKELFPALNFRMAKNVEEATLSSSIVSFATTASSPWIVDSSIFKPGATLLHVSLRDLDPAVVLSCDNVVDDLDHVCRANTSVHLAECEVGNREFVNAELPDLLNTNSPLYNRSEQPVIFSPFGLGILDIAVGKWLLEKSYKVGVGNKISNFFPEPWCNENEGDLS